MTRFLYTFVTNLVSSAIALLLARVVLSEWVTLNVAGFLIAVVVFTIAQSVLSPFVFTLARKYASAMLGGIGLVSTFLALWIATLFPGGLRISGVGWILATILIWIVTALGSWLLVGVLLKRHFQKKEDERIIARAKERMGDK